MGDSAHSDLTILAANLRETARLLRDRPMYSISMAITRAEELERAAKYLEDYAATVWK